MQWMTDRSRPRVARAALALSVALVLAGSLHQASAEGVGPAVDELDLARHADELGDARLRAALEDPSARPAAAWAARSAALARAPEALIPALARLACGRDPALAPEASHALRRIAERLTVSELAAREVLQTDLRDARHALACVAREPLPRADIVFELAQLGAALDALLR